MARRGEEFARLNAGGGYSQALAVGKGFTGAERSVTKSSLRGSGGGRRGGGGGGGGRGVMNAFARHQELIKNYHRYHLNAQVPLSGAVEAKGMTGQAKLTDEEALRRRHRFVRDEEEDRKAYQARGLQGAAADPTAWEVRMASRYYKLLFKEYALADLSRYREDKVGLRWRTEKDVVSGKGQFECGALRCQERRDLHSYELNFKYKEEGVVKNELVKVRVCPQCARKLYRKKIEQLRAQRQRERDEADRERRRGVKAGLAPTGQHPLSDNEEDRESSSRDGELPSRSSCVATPTPAATTTKAGTTTATTTSPPSEEQREEDGHDLVRQAVEASSNRTGASTLNSVKRRRESRWGGRPDDVDRGSEVRSGGTGGGGGGSGSGDGSGKGDEGDGAGVSGGGDGGVSSMRRAWAGELEVDRTAEDEMDEYLSALLL